MSHLIVSNIIAQKNQAHPGWDRDNKIVFDDNAVQAVDNSLALNAIPTPFAREEVVAQAFQIVSRVGFKNAGKSFQKLVSDTLDVFEIISHFNLYEKNVDNEQKGEYITIVKGTLSDMNYPAVNTIVGNSSSDAINPQNNNVSYLKKALLGQNHQEEIYFVVLKQNNRPFVLAATSEKTVFYTTSRLDKNNNVRDYDTDELAFCLKRRIGNGEFFGDEPLALKDRDPEFIDYMCRFFNENRTIIATTPLGQYLSNVYQNTLPAGSVKTNAIKDEDGLGVKIPMPNNNEISLKYYDVVNTAELINEDVINLRYRINSKKFVTMPGLNADMQLLPVNLSALARMDKLTIEEGDFERKARKIRYNGDGKNSGSEKQITDIDKNSILNFDLGVYPFFEYREEDISKDFETYDIVLVYEFENAIAEDAMELEFWDIKDGKLIKIPRADVKDKERTLAYFVDRRIRTNEKSSGKNVRTVHYKIFGTNFKYIEVISNMSNRASGVLVPKFDSINQNNQDTITFAVDFGTTSTHIAYTGSSSFKTKEESMVMLHGNPDEHNIHPVRRYENYNSPSDPELMENIEKLVNYIQNEFVPSSFDGEVYKFPVRTAVSLHSQCNIDPSANPSLSLFSEANMSSTYEKEPAYGNNIFVPNLKWVPENLPLTKLYIMEIIKLCVNKALYEGYKKENIQFVNFLPLCIGDMKEDIEDAWSEACAQNTISMEKVTTITESLAPYYAVKPSDAKCAISIDIGGGSVDFAVFKDSHPQYVSSVRFGCDVIWGGGKSTERYDKSNPIFAFFINDMIKKAKTIQDKNVLKVLQKMTGISESETSSDYFVSRKVDTKYSSIDIINFWLGNSKLDFANNRILKKDFKPAFVAHMFSIIYHIAQVMKANDPDLLPTSISFSGNGCKYISYLGEHTIKDIVASAFAMVFYGDDGHVVDAGAEVTALSFMNEPTPTFNKEDFKNKLEVLLPTDQLPGKQRTAVGGIKIKEDGRALPAITQVIYYGEVFEDHLTYKTKPQDSLVTMDSANIPRLNEEFVKSICKNVEMMQDALFNLLDSLQLSDALPRMGIDECRTALKDNVETNADTTILSAKQHQVQSSLFFSPIKQLIFNFEKSISDNLTVTNAESPIK